MATLAGTPVAPAAGIVKCAILFRRFRSIIDKVEPISGSSIQSYFSGKSTPSGYQVQQGIV